MTCIVGLVDGGRVFIGGDSAGTSDWHLQIRADRKVFESSGFLYGFSGSFRAGQILQYCFEPPVTGRDDPDLMRYMVGEFIPALRAAIECEVGKEDRKAIHFDFLVGFRERLFAVSNDMQVGEFAAGFGACGCGRDPALGALTVLHRVNVDPAWKLKRALEAAEQWNSGVRGPFTVLSIGSGVLLTGLSRGRT